ncbi:conserved protein [Tepidicaulis marinus]|uniref:Conserved protein n=1 Tax=Tepidicaulis marinus TaxID=1333998 RepID=A0A081BDE3_9HYPH|nr:hypothetical protein [Tepidicaulis marinus]GAK46061.1 conserved protein [Tepidicaulis marinus]
MDAAVKERPAWLIPLVAALAILGLSVIFLYYYFGPSANELLGLSPKATASDEIVEVSVGGKTLYVPSHFTRYPAQRGGTQEELALHALLPDLTPFSPEERALFEDNSPNSRVVLFSLKAGDMTLPEDQRFAAVYSRYFSGEEPKEVMNGREHYAFAEGSGYRDQDLFLATDEQGEMLLLLCFRETPVIFSPSCSRTKVLPSGLVLTYRYKRARLKNWAAIDRNIQTLVDSFSEKPRQAAPAS